MTPDFRALVAQQLAVVGIPASEEEIVALAADYPGMLESIAALYRIDGVKYEEAAITFRPVVTLEEAQP